MTNAVAEPTQETKEKKPKTRKIAPAKGELPLVVEVPDTPLARASIKMAECQKAYDEALKALGECKTELVKCMKNAKRYLVQVRGFKFNRTHVGPKEGIKVEKVK
jgi:hypothetical protein